MAFGTAHRGTQHAMGTSDAVYTPRWRVIASLVVAKDMDGLNQYCYAGDTLAWLSEAQEAHFTRLKLVERIPEGEQGAEESSVVDECIVTLMRLQVPANAGAPTARTALRDAGHRFGNDVISHAVRRRKELSRTADDDEDSFEAVEF
jgi:cytochrome c oxidase cbb3-type subunit 2